MKIVKVLMFFNYDERKVIRETRVILKHFKIIIFYLTHISTTFSIAVEINPTSK